MTQIDQILAAVTEAAGPGDLFLLKSPTAVPSAGISAEDWVVARRQSAAGNGEVAVLMAGGDTVLSACPPDGAHVVGVAVSVIRML